MVKKKNRKNSMNLIRKGIALLISIVTFVFFFLEMMDIRVKTTVLGKENVENERVKFSDLLFNEDYEVIREELNLASTVMWVVFVLVIVAVGCAVLGLVMNKGTTFSKLGSVILLVAMALLFVVNLDVATLDFYIAKGDINISNITSLYFVSLALSTCSFASVITLKK